MYTGSAAGRCRRGSSLCSSLGLVQTRAQIQRAGTRAAFLLEKACSGSSSAKCAFHLPLFSFKILLAAEEADQERETRVTKISQYCQISARSISAGRHQKCRFHCARARKSRWEQQLGWGCWGGRRGWLVPTEPCRWVAEASSGLHCSRHKRKTQSRTRAAPVPRGCTGYTNRGVWQWDSAGTPWILQRGHFSHWGFTQNRKQEQPLGDRGAQET